MSDYWPGYLDYPDNVQLALYRAAMKRMQRTEDETAAVHQRLARQRIRAILNRIKQRNDP